MPFPDMTKEDLERIKKWAKTPEAKKAMEEAINKPKKQTDLRFKTAPCLCCFCRSQRGFG